MMLMRNRRLSALVPVAAAKAASDSVLARLINGADWSL